MKTFAMMPLGCKVNDFESTAIKNELLKEYKMVSFKEKADIYLVFSCCVTNTAEAKTRKFIHQARRNNPNGYIVVIGCLAQINPTLPDFEDVDLLIGSSKKDQVVNLIKKGIRQNCVEDISDCHFENLFINEYPGKDRAFLKIQDGCNQFCSYCIIPYARGKERSCNHSVVIPQAKQLAKNYKEIVLTGIHTGRYFDGEFNLAQLLKELIKIEGINTIRLSSIEITEITDEIIELMATSNKIAHHLHIPVQSACTKVLKMMHRPYTMCEFKERVKEIREKVPGISISTDLIVGFPGESDELFKTTLNNLKKIKFSFIHVFPYSRKKGTVADKLENHVAPDVKKQRVKSVMELQDKITRRYQKSFIHKEVEVLIEKNNNDFSYGYSKEYLYIAVKGKYTIGDIVKVRILSADDKIIGEYVS